MASWTSLRTEARLAQVLHHPYMQCECERKKRVISIQQEMRTFSAHAWRTWTTQLVRSSVVDAGRAGAHRARFCGLEREDETLDAWQGRSVSNLCHVREDESSGLLRCIYIHLNPHVLEWNGIKFSLISLQSTSTHVD